MADLGALRSIRIPIARAATLKRISELENLEDLNVDLAKAMGSSPQAATFWGMAVFEAESYEKLLEVFSHPDYQRVVFPDEKTPTAATLLSAATATLAFRVRLPAAIHRCRYILRGPRLRA